MAKVKFSVSVYNKLGHKFKKDIRDSIIGSPDMRKEIQRTLDMANKRIKRLDESGLVSTALTSLKQGGTDKFSIRGLGSGNETTWEMAKVEYGRAIAFLNNPTSTLQGARQYVKTFADKSNQSFETTNEQLKYKIEEFIENGQAIDSPILRELYHDVEREGHTIENESQEYANALERNLNNAVNGAFDSISRYLDNII